MGGTFNPIHYGHLMAAQEAMIEFHLGEILFIPNQVPPHRQGEGDIISGHHRLIMACLAISSNPYFKASTIELERPEVSYTVDTIRELKKIYGETEISFITGADSLIKYDWHNIGELLDLLTYFIVATRPGFSLSNLDQKIREMKLANAHKIKPLQIPNVDISSTEIRRRLKLGKPIKYLVPEAVADYIYKNKLYI